MAVVSDVFGVTPATAFIASVSASVMAGAVAPRTRWRTHCSRNRVTGNNPFRPLIVASSPHWFSMAMFTQRPDAVGQFVGRDE
jgi:hypothetical protein